MCTNPVENKTTLQWALPPQIFYLFPYPTLRSPQEEAANLRGYKHKCDVDLPRRLQLLTAEKTASDQRRQELEELLARQHPPETTCIKSPNQVTPQIGFALHEFKDDPT